MSDLMTCRVFFDDERQGWFWCETLGEDGQYIGDMVGPFESAIEAGKHARKAVVNRIESSAHESSKE